MFSDNKSALSDDDHNDGLPDIGNDSPFKLDSTNDPFFFKDDTAETIVISDSDDNLVPYDSPLYQNQEQDPKIAQMMFDQLFESD